MVTCGLFYGLGSFDGSDDSKGLDGSNFRRWIKSLAIGLGKKFETGLTTVNVHSFFLLTGLIAVILTLHLITYLAFNMRNILRRRMYRDLDNC